jgi:hypothetical protein
MDTPHAPEERPKQSLTIDTRDLPSIKEYGIGDTCTFTVKGKVTNISKDDHGMRFTFELDKYSQKPDKSVDEKMRDKSMDPVSRKMHKDIDRMGNPVVDVRTQVTPSVS